MGKSIDCPQILLAGEQAGVGSALSGLCREQGWHIDEISDLGAIEQALGDDKYDVLVTDSCLPLLADLNSLRNCDAGDSARAIFVVDAADSSVDVCKLFRQGVRAYFQTDGGAGAIDRVAQGIVSAVSWGRQEERSGLMQLTEYTLSSRALVDRRFPLVIAENLFEQGVLEESKKLRIELAFQEALTNCLEHGNLALVSSWKDEYDADGIDRYSLMKQERIRDSKYADRLVNISVQWDGKVLSMRIRDEGEGFDYSARVGENPEPKLDCHGRGLSLIGQIVDRFSFSDSGRELEMEVYI
jgi:anti-sigma regulatory factor (Ser/Thr protein kinase)